MRLRIGSGPTIEFSGARHQQPDHIGHDGDTGHVRAILWYVKASAAQVVSREHGAEHGSESDDLRAALSPLTHSVEHRNGGYLKVTLTSESARLSNLAELDDLLRRYGFEAIDEPAAR